jgi:hypothetical protein
LGFIGTLIGVILQVLLARTIGAGVLSSDFMGGMLFAVTTTLQGVFTALYAYALRHRLLREMDGQLEETLRLVGVGLLPGLGDEDTRIAHDVAEILRASIDSLEQRFVAMSQHVGRTVAAALEGVPEAIAISVGKVLGDRLGDSVSNAVRQLEVAVTTGVAALRQSLQSSDQALAKSSTTLERASDVIRTEIQTAVRTPGDLTRELQQSRHEVSQVATAFADIAAELRDAGAMLRQSDDELLVRARNHATAQEQTKERVEAVANQLDRAAQTFEATLRHLALVVEKLVDAHVDRLDRDAEFRPPVSPMPPPSRGLFGRFRAPRGSANGQGKDELR